MLCEMRPVSSRIWTRVVVSISYDDNQYTKGTSIFFYDTRSLFKLGLTGLNSEYSFS